MNNRTKYILILVGVLIAAAILGKYIFSMTAFLFGVPIAFGVGYVMGRVHGKRSAND